MITNSFILLPIEMFDETASSQCEGENLIYRLFWKFLKGKTKEEAIKDILKEDKPDKEDLPTNEEE